MNNLLKGNMYYRNQTDNKMKVEDILVELYKVNNSLRKEHSGLYVASVGDEYNEYVWVRDTYYQVKPNLKKNPEAYIQTYRSLLDYYKGLNYKYDDKINELIRKPFPLNNIRFIHPRFFPNLKEITGNWGNLQLDSFGYFFLGIAEGIKEGLDILRDESDVDIINRLIKVLYKIQFWTIADNGIWEEKEEIHASSIGAILSGLTALEEVEFIIPKKLFAEGFKKLNELLPNESSTKNVDLSLLTLLFPFNIVSDDIKEVILDNVHKYLEKERGIIRYQGDKYFNTHKGKEAEWQMGHSFLYMIYKDTNPDKANFYLEKIIKCSIKEDSKIPELYFGETDIPNVNTPLGWATALAILVLEDYLENDKHDREIKNIVQI